MPAGAADGKRELHASPQRLAKDSERNLIETFRNCEENPGQHYEGAETLSCFQSAGIGIQEPQVPVGATDPLSSKNIMKSIYYQNIDTKVDKEHDHSDFQVGLRQLEFKSIAAEGEKTLILLELIDMMDKKTSKKRSMVAVTMVPASAYSESAKEGRLKDIQKLCQQQASFEDVYSGLNEKYINEIIDQESAKQKATATQCCPTCGRGGADEKYENLQSFLLIGEDEVKKQDEQKLNSKQDMSTSPIFPKDKSRGRKSETSSNRVFSPSSQCINIEKVVNSRNFNDNYMTGKRSNLYSKKNTNELRSSLSTKRPNSVNNSNEKKKP